MQKPVIISWKLLKIWIQLTQVLDADPYANEKQ